MSRKEQEAKEAKLMELELMEPLNPITEDAPATRSPKSAAAVSTNSSKRKSKPHRGESVTGEDRIVYYNG